MINNGIGRRNFMAFIWPAALLGTAAAVGLWLTIAPRNRVQGLLAFGVLGLTAIAGIVWQFRARATRRLRATWDAYAQREITRALRKNTPKRKRNISTPKGVARSHRAS